MKKPVARSPEYWAHTRPHEQALCEGETVLTCREWNDYADQLADALTDRGIGLDDVIAVRCCNRLEWAVIALAAAKVDARLLTLDPALAPQAVRERLILSGATAVIVGDGDPRDLMLALQGLQMKLRATLDQARPGFFCFYDLFPPAAPPRFAAAQPSLVSWTQGYAGRPQPVAIPRRRAALASLSRPALPDAGCSLITVPLHHSWAWVQFWSAVGAGRTVVFLRTFDPLAALRVIARRRVTRWQAFPDMLQRVADLPEEAIHAIDLSSLRDLTVGGAVAPWALKARLMAIFGPIVGEAYGSAETGVIAIMPPNRQAQKPGSCGRPPRGVMIEIRDRDGRALPPNAVGEIWARTQRSLECGLVDAHGRRDPMGFVATADLGRIDEDGFLFITGRAPRQDRTDLLRAG